MEKLKNFLEEQTLFVVVLILMGVLIFGFDMRERHIEEIKTLKLNSAEATANLVTERLASSTAEIATYKTFIQKAQYIFQNCEKKQELGTTIMMECTFDARVLQ